MKFGGINMKKTLFVLLASGLVLLIAGCATTKPGPKSQTKAPPPKTAPAKTAPAKAAPAKSADAKVEPKSAAKPVAKSDKEIADDLNKRLKASGLKNVEVKTTKRGVTITAGALNFPAESAQITADTAKRLDGIAVLLKGYESKKILIQGHTADVGDKKSQQVLSLKRAQAVADYFVRKGVLKASQLVIEGKGGTVPLAPNDKDEGRAKNRRVEITLLH
jgi:outer membrane protein OmpA-like peptidoglycan-associated protein